MMQVTELVLNAAAAASVTPDGKKCRFTLRDVKRELKQLYNPFEVKRYRVSQGDEGITTGAFISYVLSSVPELYTPIYHQQPSCDHKRIVGFKSAIWNQRAEGGEA